MNGKTLWSKNRISGRHRYLFRYLESPYQIDFERKWAAQAENNSVSAKTWRRAREGKSRSLKLWDLPSKDKITWKWNLFVEIDHQQSLASIK